MSKLAKTKVPLDETDSKLFPRPKRAKANFDKTITQKSLTHKHKRDRLPVGRTKINKGKDMKKAIKAQRYAALTALTAGTIYGISQYTSDMLVLVGGIVLTMLIVEKAK